MKVLFILISSLLPTSLWAFGLHAFATEYIDLRQANGSILGITTNGTAQSLSLSSGRLIISEFSPPDEPARPDSILFDGELASGSGNIKKAWLGGPTQRYDHGVLGDTIEATRLYAQASEEPPVFFELVSDRVFEDRFPRLVDLDGDGEDELIVIRTDINSGAAIAVYGVKGGNLKLEAASETIGLSHRWLNIVGIEDFNGDDIQEIAAVITPHIGGTLTLFQKRGNRLLPVAEDHGYSNHQYGSRELGMSAILDINGDGVMDMAVPDAKRKDLFLTIANNNHFKILHRIENPAAINSGIYVGDLDNDFQPELVYLLEDHTLKVIDF